MVAIRVGGVPGMSTFQQEIVWFMPRGWSFTFGLAFVCSGLLIFIVAVMAAVYGGLVAGFLIAVFGFWLIWHPRNVARRVIAMLAEARTSIQPANPHPGDIVLCSLMLRPSKSVRLCGWRCSLSLMYPDDNELEEYRGAIGSAECRTLFEPRTLGIGEEVTLTAALNLQAFSETLAEDGSREHTWRLDIEVETTSPRCKLHSKAISFTAAAAVTANDQ